MKTKIGLMRWLVGSAVVCFLGVTACSQQSSPPAASNKTAVSSSNASTPLSPTGPLTHLTQRSGSKMRLEGTSTAHDWQSESGVIMGFLDAGPNFPLEPGQTVA